MRNFTMGSSRIPNFDSVSKPSSGSDSRATMNKHFQIIFVNFLIHEAICRVRFFPESSMSCYVTTQIFGQPLRFMEKSVIVHKLGFSKTPFDNPTFQNGSDCICDKLPCVRRLSEYCVPKRASADPVKQTYESYRRMNPHLSYVGVIIVINFYGKSEQTFIEQMALLTRMCYPWLAVFCSFYNSGFDVPAARLPWLRECCDAVLIPSRKLETIPEEQTLYRTEDGVHQTLVFTLAPYRYACNKCGITKPLDEASLQTPEGYVKEQTRANGKVIPVAARHREAYLHVENSNPPERLRVTVTGGFEQQMVESLAKPYMMNFSFFFMGNTTRWTSGGATLNNGTFDGMLDLISKRNALLAVSNQKPFSPADEIFTFTDCYDVDTLPFASRIETRPVTIKTLFRSFGRRSALLLAGSSVFVSVATHLFLQLPKYRLNDLLGVTWFFAMRLFQNSFSMRLLTSEHVPARVNFVVVLWSLLAVVFGSMFDGVWVTFSTTPPFRGFIDNFDQMTKYITATNSTAYMSPGLLSSASIYNEASQVIFEHGFPSTDAEFIVDRLLTGRRRHFWFYEKILLIYSLNKFDANGTIHISSEYFFIQQQCWVMQKNCGLEEDFSKHLVLLKEAGLLNRLKGRANVLHLAPRIPEDPFKPVRYSQIREIILFVFVVPPFMLAVMLVVRCAAQMAKLLPRRKVSLTQRNSGSSQNSQLATLQAPDCLYEIQNQLHRRHRDGTTYAEDRNWSRTFQPEDSEASWELLRESR